MQALLLTEMLLLLLVLVVGVLVLLMLLKGMEVTLTLLLLALTEVPLQSAPGPPGPLNPERVIHQFTRRRSAGVGNFAESTVPT